VNPEVRKARGQLLDLPWRGSLLDVPPSTPGVPPPPPSGAIVDLILLPELPLNESDVVVVGDIVNAQPFLTNSNSAMYTEFTIRASETIKPKLPITNSLIVLRRGGKARLPSGRIIEWDVRDTGDPLFVGQRCLLFLSYYKSADAYLVNKMWHVRNGFIKAAFPIEKAQASKSQSENDGKLLSEVIYSLRAKLGN
jgi:hypothetical protein